jgi:prepilin-type N-terminal cleavage/methylation domain-containing protein
MKHNSKQSGFTLIELSIVIVIIGFLVAGITVGASLIKQAQLRGVITEIQQYQTAYNNFIGKYDAVPGDMLNADKFWPSAVVGDVKQCATTLADCNGNGNGLINYSNSLSGANGGNESAKAWKHLALSESISAGISVLSSPDLVIGVSVPNSRIDFAGYFMAGPGPFAATNIRISATTDSPWQDNRTNALFLGRPVAGSSLLNASLKAEEAYNIDNKLDDGIINAAGNFAGGKSGNIRVVDGENVAAGDCVSSTGLYKIDGSATTNREVCVLGAALN